MSLTILFNKFSEKKKRIISRCVWDIFSRKAISDVPIRDALKEHGIFHNILTVGNNIVVLSHECLSNLSKIVDLIYSENKLCSQITRGDIHRKLINTYKKWILEERGVDSEAFVDEIVSGIFSTVSTFNYLIPMDGIELKDIDKIIIGKFYIQRPDRQLFQQLKIDEQIGTKSSYNMFNAPYWIIGAVNGSPDASRAKFERGVKIIVGMIAIYGCILYKTAFTESKVRTIDPPAHVSSTVHMLRWTDQYNNPSLSADYRFKQPLPFYLKDVEYFKKECFYDLMSACLEDKQLTQLQSAVYKSLYWMSDAYTEDNNVMCFVKLWTCIECFFSFDKNFKDMTKNLSAGMASILTFAGYGIVKTDNYTEFKKKITKLYGYRSKALHTAKFDHITSEHINELAQLVSWLILSMLALVDRGYTSLGEVREQVIRLDNIMCRR